MNRDIIKEFDIKYRVNERTHETEPYINLKVEIDDKDFDAEYGAYIEDIKLYNQDSFVNPTNASSGISIMPDISTLTSDESVDVFQLVEKSINDLFVEDENGDYKKTEAEDDYELAGELYTGTRYTFNAYIDSEGIMHNDYYYIYDSVNKEYNTIEFDDRKNGYFYIETKKLKAYENKNLQADPAFAQNFNISDDLIIVSVKIHPHPDDECQSDYIIKVIYNKAVFKKDIIVAIGEIADRCVIPMRLIDLFLRYKAFDVAIEVGDVEYICRLFKIFKHAKGFNNAIEYAPCGCLKH